jgi:integrase
VGRTPERLRRRNRPTTGEAAEEARTFLHAVSDHRLHAAFHLCLVTGLRRGEILALRWDDVDMERLQLEVVQQLAIERGRPVLKELKTDHSERLVTFGITLGTYTHTVPEQHRQAGARLDQIFGPRRPPT